MARNGLVHHNLITHGQVEYRQYLLHLHFLLFRNNNLYLFILLAVSVGLIIVLIEVRTYSLDPYNSTIIAPTLKY